MTNFLKSWWCLTSWWTFWRHDGLFDVMTHDVFLTYLWRHNVTFTLWLTFWHHDVPLTSWRYFYVMTYLWPHDVVFKVMRKGMISWRIFDVMINLLTYRWRYNVTLKSWRTFWRHDILLMSWCNLTLTRMMYLFMWWCIFWRDDVLFDIIPCFWHHEVLLIALRAQLCFLSDTISFSVFIVYQHSSFGEFQFWTPTVN